MIKHSNVRSELPNIENTGPSYPKQRLGYDGFLAPAFLLLIPISAKLFGWVWEHFGIDHQLYGAYFGGILMLALSIGFAISGIRQRSIAGKVTAIITLTLLFLTYFLFPRVG